MFAALAQLGMSAYQQQQKGEAQENSSLFPAVNTPQTSVPVHVAPVGLNLGSIVSPATQGPPENGGSGLDLGRYLPVSYKTNSAGVIPHKEIDPKKTGKYLLLAAVGGSIFYFAFMRR